MSSPSQCQGTTKANVPCPSTFGLERGYCQFHRSQDATRERCRGVKKDSGDPCKINWDLDTNGYCKYHKDQYASSVGSAPPSVPTIATAATAATTATLSPRLRRYPDEPSDFPFELHALNLDASDWFLIEAIAGLGSKSCLPQQDVDSVCTRLHKEALAKCEALSANFDQEMCAFARDKLEQALNKLEQFVVAWNATKRVKFKRRSNARDGIPGDGIPGDAIVFSVDDTDVRKYKNGVLEDQQTRFWGHTCVYMQKLDDTSRDKISDLFRFKSLEYKAIRERDTGKLRGESRGCRFEILHKVKVREHKTLDEYQLDSAGTELTYSHQNVDTQTAQRTNATNRTMGVSGGGVRGSVGSSVGSSLTFARQQESTVSCISKGYRCTVDMVVAHDAHADLTARALGKLLPMGSAQKVDFPTKEVPMEVTFDVPYDFVESAWVKMSVKDLLNQLLDDPLVSLKSANGRVRIGHAPGTNVQVLTDKPQAASSGSALACTAFEIKREGDDGLFCLSVVHAGEAASQDEPSSALWVGLNREKRLILSKTPEHFALYRDSRRYKRWVLRATSRKAFVERRDDGFLYAAAKEPQSGYELTISRA